MVYTPQQTKDIYHQKFNDDVTNVTECIVSELNRGVKEVNTLRINKWRITQGNDARFYCRVLESFLQNGWFIRVDYKYGEFFIKFGSEPFQVSFWDKVWNHPRVFYPGDTIDVNTFDD